jgi:hypothetical protein
MALLTWNLDATAVVFEMSCLPFLFFTAMKCRDASIRRTALSLMVFCPRKTGIWDSFLCIKVAEWMMNLEEAGMVDVGSPANLHMPAPMLALRQTLTCIHLLTLCSGIRTE